LPWGCTLEHANRLGDRGLLSVFWPGQGQNGLEPV